MSLFEDSNHFEIRLEFWNRSKSIVESRDGGGYDSGMLRSLPRYGGSIRDWVMQILSQYNIRNLDLTQESFDFLESMEVYFQTISVDGSCLLHYHYTIEEGLCECVVYPTDEYLRDKMLFNYPGIDGESVAVSEKMIEQQLRDYANQYGTGSRTVLSTEFKREESLARREAYLADCKAEWPKCSPPNDKSRTTKFVYNDTIEFILPPGFTFSRDKDDDGDESVNIMTGEYENDKGETCYKFNCCVSYNEYDPDENEDGLTSDNLLDFLALRIENARRMKLQGEPETILLNKAVPLSFFGHIIKLFTTFSFIRTSPWAVVQLNTTNTLYDDPSANLLVYENMYEVLKAIRVNGMKLNIDGLTPEQIKSAIELTFEDDSAIDVSPKLQFNITAGDETTTYEYTSEGMKEVGKEYFTRVTPDEALYPHYNSVRCAGGSGFFGATVVVNASGTEYNFIPFRNVAEDYDTEESTKALYNRILAEDTERYDLDQKAKEMQKLFHVNPAVFDPRHDRECELQEGYLHRAYMLSALRSFAWTLADYCEKQNLAPGDINYAQAHRIVEFAAENDWLNYDGETYCRGLCGGSDFHVYFVPDSTAQTDRESLLPCEEDLERVRKMKERFSSYNKTLPEVHSLDALRKDLTYIYPAVRTLADRLAATRDNNQPLLGNDADIVYAWCALALAAKGPFFSEDGPMRCFFTQIQSPEERIAAQKQKVEADSAQNTNAWMEQYGGYITKNPKIVFEGKLFVFSGLGSKSAEKDHPIVKRIAEKGGQYRTSISGRTDYLVVNPVESGVSQINAVIAQREKGKIIRVILLEELEKALEDKPTVPEISKTAAKAVETTGETAKTAKPAKPKATGAVNKIKGTRVSWADCSIDAIGTLTSYKGSATEIILPDGIRKIGETAFFHEDEIASVIIPEGVETIEESAFWGCLKLKTVVLPSTLKTIGKYAFCECEQLASILIPEGVESIDGSAFSDCSNLKTVELPSSLKKIGEDAFRGCEQLASILIPEGVETIEESAFWGCLNLKTVVLPGTLKTIGKYAFCECEQLASIVIPEGVESIESGSFEGCFNMKTIILPGTLKRIGEDAFYGYEQLTNVIISEGIDTIGDGAFWGCSNLKTVELPSSLKKIGENAFRGCNQLASIVIPDGCEEIGEDCFDGCEKMKDIFVPASVREIGHDAFFTSNNATVIHIVIPEGVEVIESGVFSSSDDLKTIILPDILKLIGNSEFLECLALVSIVLPTTLKTIGDHAFANCHHFSDITIPEGIETIGNSAFEDCSDLVSIVLPTTLKTIGGRAFANCTQLSNIIIPEGIETIGDSAFFWCEDLKTVILPGTLKIIGDSAFSNCIELSDIIIPEGVETIESSAFEDCSALVSIALPTTLKTIGCSAFASCIQLSDILIPEGIETIGNYAFEACSALISIVLPTTLKTIGFSAFAYCSQLSNIIIPEAIEVIEDGAFLNCLELKSVILPDSLKIIGEEAFRSCEQLAAIVIPDGCETIGDSCFMFCAQLKDVFVPESVRNIGNDAFGRLSCATVIHTLKDSTAEAVAKEWHLQVEYDYGQTASNVETVSASEHIEVPVGSINEMEGAIHNLSAQSTETASPDFCKHDSQPLVRENGSIERATELQKYSTIESGMERAETYLYALVKFSKHDDFLTTFTFPGRFDIDITPENQPFFNWQTSNSPSSMTGETDGLAEVINFSCAFTDMISSQKVGGLYDALVMVFPETYDSRYNDLVERINAQMENDCADAVLLVALNFKSGAYMQKSCLLDYRTGTCETVDAEISAADAEIAKKDAAAFMEETLEQQYAFSERQTSLRLEAEARKRQVSTVILLLSMIQGRKEAEAHKHREEEERKRREEEARQRKEAEERKAEYDDLVRRKAEQEQIVAENQGGFLGLGKKAKLRREAMSKIEEINEKLKLYPEFL